MSTAHISLIVVLQFFAASNTSGYSLSDNILNQLRSKSLKCRWWNGQHPPNYTPTCFTLRYNVFHVKIVRALNLQMRVHHGTWFVAGFLPAFNRFQNLPSRT